MLGEVGGDGCSAGSGGLRIVTSQQRDQTGEIGGDCVSAEDRLDVDKRLRSYAFARRKRSADCRFWRR